MTLLEAQELINRIQKLNKIHITFNEATHKYLVDGMPVQSVSNILKPLTYWEYKNAPQEALEIGISFGKEVHKLLEDYENQKWNDEMISQLRPLHERIISNYIKWKSENGLEHLASELQIYNHNDNYIGTIDAVYYDKENDKILIVDFKTSKEIKEHYLYQLGLYKDAFRVSIYNLSYFDEVNYSLCILKIGRDGIVEAHNNFDSWDIASITQKLLTIHNINLVKNRDKYLEIPKMKEI